MCAVFETTAQSKLEKGYVRMENRFNLAHLFSLIEVVGQSFNHSKKIHVIPVIMLV